MSPRWPPPCGRISIARVAERGRTQPAPTTHDPTHRDRQGAALSARPHDPTTHDPPHRDRQGAALSALAVVPVHVRARRLDRTPLGQVPRAAVPCPHSVLWWNEVLLAHASRRPRLEGVHHALGRRLARHHHVHVLGADRDRTEHPLLGRAHLGDGPLHHRPAGGIECHRRVDETTRVGALEALVPIAAGS